MTALFDLIYVSGPDGRMMSCGVLIDGQHELLGPYPAAQAGPEIVKEMMARPAFGFSDIKEAERAYTIAHFRNMSRGENDAGLAYPHRV